MCIVYILYIIPDFDCFIYMGKNCFIALLLLFAGKVNAQLLGTSPYFIYDTTASIDIIADATKGNQGLKDYAPTTDVYAHIGCITSASSSSSDWKYSKFTWGSTNPAAQCTYLGNNKWKYTITGGLRTFFGITNAAEKIGKIAILFRNGSGSSVLRNIDGGDMYLPVADNALMVRISSPYRQPNYAQTVEPITKNAGDILSLAANASQPATLNLYFNGAPVVSQSYATSVSANVVIASAGAQTIIAEAISGTLSSRDTLGFFVSSPTVTAPLPSGVKDGINYEGGDTSLVLVLYAPLKKRATVVGDFNNWTESSRYQMNQTPDSSRFWLRITGLTPGVEYAYQYLVDGTLKVADYNTEKVLDPSNDPYISTATYPSLKAYPTGKTTGIVGIIQTAKPVYNWQVNNFNKPDKRNLVIYELLVRDFVAAQNWQTLKDTLSYIKRLGVNAIEVMPFNEFEGNNSWGYNPSFYFAPDKAYGTETALKQFIDECHKQGIAVIMDMVLNHSFGQSSMVQMYWDAANNRPAPNSPWFNITATHPFSVGYDYNHESQATKDFVDRVIAHWLVNYKIDGFRWDLSKGFTQTNNPTDVNAWSAYDASRIAIWKRIYDKMQSVAANSYCILEHFAANQEEIVLSDYGMLLWGNGNYNFNQATMGYNTDWNFQSGIFKSRGWNNPNLVTYMESHDEERLMYKNISFGNTSGSYNIKDLNTALKRNEMATAFWAMMPGPKLLWQFGELGYDYSISRCENGTLDAGNCRTSPKPVRWDYATNVNRVALYNVYAQLIKLRLSPNYFTTFTTANVSYDLSGPLKWLKLDTDSLKVMVIGNFDVVPASASVSFPSAGTWYSYLTGATRSATGLAENISLQPGEYYVYTSRNAGGTVITAVDPVADANTASAQLVVSPNPVTHQATVKYELPVTGNVLLDVWSMNGKRLKVLVNGFKAKGSYQLSMNRNGFAGERLPAGVYLIRLTVNGKQQAKSFLITE
ncbi:MAG: hypothetical protein NVS3B15_07150 [Sediminibacterium sp.]